MAHTAGQILRGAIRSSAMANNMHCGVGRNDASYQVTTNTVISGKTKTLWRCPLYLVWSGMIKRCYSKAEQAQHPTYIGCSVAPEWHSFSEFREWMLMQDWEGKHLDKDILFPGNKVYSPCTCIFASRQLNNFITDRRASRGEWPIGVCWHKDSGKFTAYCKNPYTGKQEHLGYFTEPDAAHEAWRARKHQHALRYADMQTDQRIARALRARYAIN